MSIHPTASVSAEATIGQNVTIGPRAVIEGPVTIGDDCVIETGAVIRGVTSLGPKCHVFPYALIGMEPQDLSYKGEPTRTTLGANNVIREFVTIHRATAKGHGETLIGDNNLLMANTHIAHDCQVGSGNIFSNAATLAGHTRIGNFVTVGGVSAFHQHSRVGDYAFIGGCSAVSQDVPPFFLAAGNHAVANGINRIGLGRRGFSEADIRSILTCFKILYLRNTKLSDAVEQMRSTYPESPHVQALITFIESSQRGIVRYGKPNA